MAAGLRMSTSVLVDLALEDFFLGVFGLPVFLAGRELWDLDFLILVGMVKDVKVTSNMRDYLPISSGLGTVVSGNWMASAGTVIPHLFMSCCRRNSSDSFMNEGAGLSKPVNSFVASKTQLGFKYNMRWAQRCKSKSAVNKIKADKQLSLT